MDEFAQQVRGALMAEDPAIYGELLDPDVTWGAPGARSPSVRTEAALDGLLTLDKGARSDLSEQPVICHHHQAKRVADVEARATRYSPESSPNRLPREATVPRLRVTRKC